MRSPVTGRPRRALFPAAAALAGLALAAGSSCRGRAGASTAVDEAVASALRERIAETELGVGMCVGNEPVRAEAAVSKLYERRAFRPAWSSGGAFGRSARELVEALRSAPEQGLTASDYHAERLSALPSGPATGGRPGPAEIGSLAAFDLLLTDAFLLYAAHLADGKVEHATLSFGPRWSDRRGLEDAARLLESALDRGTVAATLGGLPPVHEAYRRLARALSAYRAIEAAGGWPPVPAGSRLAAGDIDPRVPVLRRRLAAEGFGAPGPDSELFDPALAAAVCGFQESNGLPASGALDEATRKALAVPAADKARRIAVNLERWRWLDHDLGATYAFVDAAIYEMFVVDRGREVLRMKVVSGTPVWPTPVFSSRMTEIVLNPSWVAPPRILLRELIEYVRSDPAYLSRNKMTLMRGWGAEAREVDPKTIDYADLRAETLDFYLRQEPGPLNLLGRMKFTHPNRYNVFLHDTPYQSDFGLVERAASHGCIRIERPIDFAVFLLDDAAGWTAGRIQQGIDSLEERTIPVRKPVRVHVFYATAWPLAGGGVAFRPDPYGQDPRIAAALEGPAPRTAGD